MTPRNPAALALAAALLPLPALAEQTNRPEDGAFISQVVFTCERGVTVPVSYVSTPQGEGFAVVQIDGQQVAMIQAVSGSGIRYRSIDPERPYEMHGKGRDGLFGFGPEGQTEDLLTACVAR